MFLMVFHTFYFAERLTRNQTPPPHPKSISFYLQIAKPNFRSVTLKSSDNLDGALGRKTISQDIS